MFCSSLRNGLRRLWACGCIAAALVAPTLLPATPAHALPMGVNISGALDWDAQLMFADLVKHSRGWDAIGGSNNNASQDANGWPTQDARTILMILSKSGGVGNAYAGTYAIQFNGQATITMAADGGFGTLYTITNQTYNSSTNTTTAQFTVPTGQGEIWAQFTNTRRTASSSTNTGLTNIKVMRPIAPGSTTPHGFNELFSRQFLSAIQQFSVLRAMDMTGTNGSDQVNWSDRKSMNYATQSGYYDGKPVAWEYVIDMANISDRDLWICVPHMATDAYVTSLAQLCLSRLESGRNLYVEYSNEVWNYGFSQAHWNYDQAQNDTSLRFGGFDDPYGLASRRHGKRTGQISQIFRSVFGNAAMGSRVRVVLGTQSGNVWHTERMLETIIQLIGPVSTHIWAISTAPYMQDHTETGTATDYLNRLRISSDENRYEQVQPMTNLANQHGVGHIAYEGGPHLTGATNLQAKIDANLAPGMRDLLLHDIGTNWNAATGGQLFVYYNLCGYYAQYGMWGLSEFIHDQNTPKWQAVKQIMGSTTSQVAAPSFSPAPGTYSSAQSVTISTATAGASIRYTTNGTDPTPTTGTLYSGPVTISATTTLKAIAYASGMTNSTITSGTYTISPALTANIAAGSATIDGTIDSAWSNATSYTLGKQSGTISSNSDLSVSFRSLWDSSNLFVLVEVTDDAKRNDSTNPWDDDSVEVYVDGNNNKTTFYDSNDRQIIFGWNDAAAVEGGGRSITGVSFAQANPGSTSYRIEARIPWNTLGVSKSAGQSIGLDVHVNDDDDSGARDGKKMWSDGTDQAWGNPSLFGTGTLQSGGSVPPTPTGLTATAGDGQVALSWNASSGATSYNVKRSTTSGSGYSTIASPTTTSYTNTGLTNGTTYYYVVSAVNSNGQSANSSQVSATPTAGSGTNLALNKPATASSVESTDFPASNAVDSSASTRWSSAWSDPQWIYVDLQGTYNINRVVLNWEVAAGRDYQIQVSSNATSWTTIHTVTGNTTSGVKDYTNLSGTGRYVRIYGTARATGYGYSLFDLQVYGTVASTTNLALSKPATASSIESSGYAAGYAVDGSTTTRWASAWSDPQWIYVDLQATYNINRVVLNWEVAAGRDYVIQVSSNASTWTTIHTVTGNTTAGVKDYTGLSGTGRYVRIYCTARATGYGYSLWEFQVYGTSP